MRGGIGGSILTKRLEQQGLRGVIACLKLTYLHIFLFRHLELFGSINYGNFLDFFGILGFRLFIFAPHFAPQM